ncbi:hypothetical protein NECAME_17041 [Necator americanus]|uniref:Uncharacterized protein n=1 Tax=Necator americanus TaxID=51031 RepID=W2TSP7_NECAM|nr:hypothetical protein NECAME_17041 [Necator americanus]ETN84689.1 hypothetical protein NECAME_17041 [Necator americanus]
MSVGREPLHQHTCPLRTRSASGHVEEPPSPPLEPMFAGPSWKSSPGGNFFRYDRDSGTVVTIQFLNVLDKSAPDAADLGTDSSTLQNMLHDGSLIEHK